MIKPIIQKRMPLDDDKKVVSQVKIGKLLNVSFVKDVLFQTWLANPDLVNIDCLYLKKLHPNDTYPLLQNRSVDGSIPRTWNAKFRGFLLRIQLDLDAPNL